MPETRSLHRKLAQVMYEAERIPKRGKAPEGMGGYPFVQVGDAADFIRKALGEHVVSMLPTAVELVGQTEHTTKSGGTMTTAELRVTWTLTDGESGESAVIQSYGVGADAGDKYSGKAMTNAMKYALLAGFLLSTGDDVERDDTTDRQARRPRGAAPTGIEPISAAAPPAAPPQRTEPTEELLGVLSKAGTVKKGGADGFQLDARQQPDGMALGFRLEVDGDRAIPQVLIEGQLGADVVDATGGRPETLEGKWAKVRGRLFQVTQPGRTSYYRLRATSIETKDWALPAEPAEAPSAALFPADIEAELDAAVPA